MYNGIFGERRVWFATLLLIALIFFPGIAAGDEAEDDTSVTGSLDGDTTSESPAGDLALDDEQFTQPPEDVSLPAIPDNPEQALITATNAHSARLGYENVNHGPAIRNSGMSKKLAGRTALLMREVLACPPVDVEGRELANGQRACAAEVNEAAAGVSRAAENESFDDIQAWPALYMDGDGSNDHYDHDYSVLIDTEGNDTYDNNAGGNLLDTLHGPEGSAAPRNRPAIGCEHPHIVPGIPGTVAAPYDCVADRQTVLIDQEGDDTYGVFKRPTQRDSSPLPSEFDRMVDGDCTNDKVVRRIMTQGAALQGNALLVDEGGDDDYNGKTGAQGTGHVGGIGILRDLGGGDDDYQAIRNSQGFALVSGLGLLQDDGGDDRYHTYMPSAKNPNAPAGDPGSGEPGSGGVVDDTNQCDRLPRMVQGTGLGGFGVPSGTGYLLDEGGNDVYEGQPSSIQDFLEPDVRLAHSSQGFGCDGSTGILEDKGGDRDKYVEGPSDREDGVSVRDLETECGSFVTPGQSFFEDDGPDGDEGG